MQNTKDRHLRILLVDDDADTREIYAEFIKAAGYEVVTAIDGLDGMEKVGQLPPDLILTGIIMPRMDGFAMAEALKKNIATARIPLVFLSHLGRKEDQERAKELGAKDFIVRDMTPPNEVLDRLKEVFTAIEYIIGIDPFDYDAEKLARDLHLNPDFLCPEQEGKRLVLKLKLRDSAERRFDAELTCI